ncbi:MAG: type II toxin-antitoxin system VapC family toxin [Nevskiaceae bacterium]|jgi:predicted nucleic acid-binding protein|nr:type II toxin-antitoxin system VapC family toxin [Nevskiaceae bacterium]
MRYLLDTNVVSEARRKPDRRDPHFHQWIEGVAAVDTALSVITLGEVLTGVIRIERRDAAQGAKLRSWYQGGLLAEFSERLLPVTREIIEIEARLQAPDPRPKADALIAATALSHGLVLVTRNVADFAGTGVTWLNPWTGQSGAS